MVFEIELLKIEPQKGGDKKKEEKKKEEPKKEEPKKEEPNEEEHQHPDDFACNFISTYLNLFLIFSKSLIFKK